MSDIFDFGFCAVDEEELEAVQKIAANAESQEAGYKLMHLAEIERTNNLYNAILPLLSNLRKNPEKDYIHWPNRIEKIDEFEAFLKSIVDGQQS